jgi:hypothetical protein
LVERGAAYIDDQEILFGMPVMSHSTMTTWIEIADQRHFCQTALSERPARLALGPNHCRTSAILTLPRRIVDALAGRCSERQRGR